MRGYKFNHLAINSTTAVATEVSVNPALHATAVVEFIIELVSGKNSHEGVPIGNSF